jgi:hypothetical protein
LHPIRALIVLAVALCAALGPAGCGGGGGGNDEDPQEVLEETANSLGSITSGVADVELNLDIEGGEQPGTVEVKAGGPFQGGEGKFPQFAIDADINSDSSGDTVSFAGGLTSTGKQAFVNYKDTDYAVPQELFDRFVTTFTQLQDQSKAEGENGQQGGSLLRPLVDPDNFADLTNEGTEDVEGTEAIHISGSLNVDALVEYLRSVAESQKATPEQIAGLDQLPESFKTSDFDFFAGEDDHMLRKLEMNIELESPPDQPDAPGSVGLELSLTLSDVNQPQTISAPATTQPFNNLLKKLPVDPGQLGVGGELPQGGLGDGGQPPSTGGSTTPPSGDASQAYLQCLSEAVGQEAVQQCAELLQ